MDFAGIVAFTIALYVRPQEIFTALATMRPAFLTMLWAGGAVLMRENGVKPKDLVKTPHDWMALAYFGWVIFTNNDEWGTWKTIYNFVGFYFVIVQALNSMRRIYLFLYWWLGCIMFIATMALLSLVGFDPTDSAYVTANSNGRLVFNTQLFNNANALGHSVIVAIPMIYFLMFWKRPIFVKEVGLIMLPVPLYCVFRTESKGSFISGFMAIMATLTFGQKKWMQIVIIFLGWTIGWGALALLPRFGDLKRAQSDEAIQGRVEAFKFGKWATENHDYGVGLNQFYPAFLAKEGDEIARASHSSYNQVSAELGKGGLLLFIGLMYVCARTLMQAKPENVLEDRVRRTCFCLVVCFGVSSWMIDFAWRAAFFVMIAIVGAYHRILQNRAPIETPDEELLEHQKREYNPVGAMAANPGERVSPIQSVAAAGAGAPAPVAPDPPGGIDIGSAQVYVSHLKSVRGAGRRGARGVSAVAPIAPLAGGMDTQVSRPYAPAVADTDEERKSGSVSMPWTKITWVDCVIMYYLMRFALYIREYAITDLFAA